jgi:hypothetical protein
MAERTGLEFACAGRGINKLLILQQQVIPLDPLKTPPVPPTLLRDKGSSLDAHHFAYI